MIMSKKDTNYSQPVQVASIDSLNSWFLEADKYKPDITFDLIIYDEAHSTTRSW